MGARGVKRRGRGPRPVSIEGAGGDDRQTDRQTDTLSVHYIMMIIVIIVITAVHDFVPITFLSSEARTA